jgi:hypothetical protein
MYEARSRYGQKRSKEQKRQQQHRKKNSPTNQKLPFDTNRRSYAHPKIPSQSASNDDSIEHTVELVKRYQSKQQKATATIQKEALTSPSKIRLTTRVFKTTPIQSYQGDPHRILHRLMYKEAATVGEKSS